MSVRNILDGTIKVGGEVMPVEPEIPENLQVTTLKASDYVTGATLGATDSLMVGTSRGNTTITPTTVTATNVATENVATEKLTVDSREVLGLQNLGDKITLTGLKADGTTAFSLSTSPKRWMYNIYPNLHVLVMTFSISTEPLSQLTIPTGLTCGDQESWWGKTLLKADDQFLYCVMQLSASDGKLDIKIDIPTASTYASLKIRTATTFY